MTSPEHRELFARLREKQVAFLAERLVSARARAEWRDTGRAAWRELLETPLGHLVDPRAVRALADAALTEERLARVLRPIVERALDAARAEARVDGAPVGRFVPKEARRKLDELLGRPGLLPEQLVRDVIETDAVEEVMRDVLFRALKEFSEKVNPFVAEWGLPAMLKRLGPFGMPGMGKTFESMRAEFERRLEPEIRKFLQGFSRRSLRTVADVSVAKADGPAFVALRRQLAAQVLALPVREAARAAEGEQAERAREIALDIAAHALSLEETRERLSAAVERAASARAERTVAEVLAELGVDAEASAELAIVIDGAVDAAWPAVRALLSNDAARTWLDAAIGEFFDRECEETGG